MVHCSSPQSTEELGGGFNYFLFSSLPGEMIQFDEYIFRRGLVQPPTREANPQVISMEFPGSLNRW